MTWVWHRPRKPSELRSQRCAYSTASKCGTRPSTKLGLRPSLPLGEQRVCTTLQSSVPQVPSLTLPSWQGKPNKSSSYNQHPPSPPRRQSSTRSLKRQQAQPRKWPMIPPCFQLPPKTLPRKNRLPTTWRLCWQLSLYLPRKTSKVKVQHAPRQPPPSLLRLQRTNL